MRQGQRALRTKTKGLRAKAWWVLRKNRVTTIDDLMLTICSGEEKRPRTNLREWLNALVASGLLKRHLKEKSHLTSYELLSDIGHKSPVVRKEGVYDPNSKTMIG